MNQKNQVMRTILPIMIITLAFAGCGKNELPTTSRGNAEGVVGNTKKVPMRVFTGYHCINYYASPHL